MISRFTLAACLLLHGPLAAASLPQLAGDRSRPECTDAMLLARHMFQSTAPRLYAPLTMPEDTQSTLLLGASELDIQNGNALTGTAEFEELPLDGRKVYWERQARGASRVVVAEIRTSWRGDTYALYLPAAEVEQDEFLSGLGDHWTNDRYPPLREAAWRPPLVFQLSPETPMWFIDVGQPYEVLSSWHVFSSQSEQAICSVTFSPEGDDPAAQLPPSLINLVDKLDEALGPGNDEGTLQPTARIRLNARHVLANAALRPWALVDADAYNSRDEIDEGLQEWAKINGSRRRLHDAILANYPAAERALAEYYASEFALQHQKAQAAAAWATDLIFRSFFVFTNGQDYHRYEGVRTNPWPEER